MPGLPVAIGPWTGGLKNVAGFGEFINDDQAYLLQNFEVDADGSLANRPSVRRAAISGFDPATNINDLRILGTWITTDQRYLLVAASVMGVHLIEPATSSMVFFHAMTKPRACVSFNGNLHIIPVVAGEGGAVLGSALNYTWQANPTMPTGITAAIYKDRLYIGQENESRLVYSVVNDFANWPAANNAGIGWDNKQPLKAILIVGSDIFIFKTDSTYRYGHSGDPARAEVRIMDGYIGTIDETTVAVYNNNTVYTLSGKCVYEMYQNNYTKISEDLDMIPVTDPTLLDMTGVSVFRERLFVRFYNHMYVLSLITQRWSEWVSARKFSCAFMLPGAGPVNDTAYMASIQDTAGQKFLYFMQDSRITGVDDNPTNADSKEGFTCKLVTKSFDFATPTYFKTILMGGMSVACSSPVTIAAIVPGSATYDALTWGEAVSQYTWESAFETITWGTNITADGDIIVKTVTPPKDGSAFGRKLIKCLGKFRYRQVQFTVEIPATANLTASFAVRLFNLTVYALQRETVVASVTP